MRSSSVTGANLGRDADDYREHLASVQKVTVKSRQLLARIERDELATQALIRTALEHVDESRLLLRALEAQMPKDSAGGDGS